MSTLRAFFLLLPFYLPVVLADDAAHLRDRFDEGLILVEQGRRAEAIELFESLVESHPGLPEPRNNLAVLYAAEGRLDMARKTLATALETHPSYAAVYVNLSEIYAGLAAKAYARALDPNVPEPEEGVELGLIRDIYELLPEPPDGGGERLAGGQKGANTGEERDE